ncbi:hypothetical protein Q5752_004582 [Cryptotrichosporon argae]
MLATHPPRPSTSTTTAEPPLPVRHLLESYTTSHPLRSPSPLPASSRVDPRLQQRLPPPTAASPLLWTLPTWLAFARFAGAKGLHILVELVRHAVCGPKRRSWGYRMTFMAAFMRNVADHTSFADIVLIRRLISIHHLIPLPADAVVTPVAFAVPAVCAPRGFFKDLDAAEQGTRELTGEWVVGTTVWKRLKSNLALRRAMDELAGKRAGAGGRPSTHDDFEMIASGLVGLGTARADKDKEADGDAPPSYGESVRETRHADPPPDRVIYYVHGGAYYVGNAATHRLLTIGISKACQARVFAITYRLAPEHAFPLPLHDVLQGYLRLLRPPLNIKPENIVVMGDSAGGGLSLALCMYLRDEGYELPAGLVLMSPWVDLTMSCGSWDECADSDVVPRPEMDDHLNPVGCYLGPQGIATWVTHPYASPLFGDLHNLPPMLIQSGDSEVLRDEITLLAHKATLAGVHVTHELYEDMVHVFQMFSWLPAAKTAINSIGRWVRQTLPRIEAEDEARGLGLGLRGVAAAAAGVPSTALPHRHGLGARDAAAVDAEVARAPQAVTATGEQVGLGLGRSQVLPDEVEAVEARRRRGGALVMDLGDAPSVDKDSLGELGGESPGGTRTAGSQSGSDAGSGTPTPTASRAPTPAPSESETAGGAGAGLGAFTSPPRLRRAHTSFASVPGGVYAGVGASPASPTHVRRRRPTTASLHYSPAASASGRAAYAAHARTGSGAASSPTSPTMSVRRRLRAPTLTSLAHGLGLVGGGGGSSEGADYGSGFGAGAGAAGQHGQTGPTTRARSMSHSDIFHLVEGYVEGGAANETVVYAPGGEIKSVGVLGEDDA